MPALTKYNSFIDELSKGGHNLATDVLKLALTNTAPNAATHTTWNATDAPPPAAANGYPAGGNTITNPGSTTTGGIFKLILTDTVFTGAAGGIGPFRYAILYNSTKSNKVIGFYDSGSSLTLALNDTFTTDFDAANGVLTVQ